MNQGKNTDIIGAQQGVGGSLNPVPASGVDTGCGHYPENRGFLAEETLW